MPSRVHLIDASMYVFRAWHSIPDSVVDRDGRPLNAVHGFTRFLLDLLERIKPVHAAAAFDESLTQSFRNELYPAYKANRDTTPPELDYQFSCCKQVAAALGLVVLSDQRYEADDLIGSAVEALRGEGLGAVIVSADKDFGQLVDHQVSQWDYARDQRWDEAGVKARLGVLPRQVVDYLALTGDAVDNIPGIPGIGAKSAAILLGHFDTLDALLSRSDEVAFLRMRGAARASSLLREHAAIARLARTLTAIALDAPVPATSEHYRRRAPALAELDDLFERLNFGPLTRSRIRSLASATVG